MKVEQTYGSDKQTKPIDLTVTIPKHTHMVRPVSDYVQAKYDDMKQMVSTILDDGVETVNTESLVDASSGNSYDIDAVALLTAAGYSSGDFLPVVSHNIGANVSTSSDTYGHVFPDDTSPIFAHDTVIGSDAQMRVYLAVFVDPGTDQIDIRLQNQTDSETAIEQTGITTKGAVNIGPLNYSPTTTTTPVEYRVEIRNGDNTTSVGLFDTGLFFGVTL